MQHHKKGFIPHQYRKPKILIHGAGFTLVEILITLVIMSLILTIAGGIFFNMFRSKKTIEEQQNLPSTLLSFYNQIEKEVKWAEEVTSTGSQLTFIDEADLEHTFYLHNERIYDSATGAYLTPEGIKVTRFEVTRFADPNLPILKFELELQSEEISTHLFEGSFIISLRKKDVAIQT